MKTQILGELDDGFGNLLSNARYDVAELINQRRKGDLRRFVCIKK